jgi:hypothetical protein
VLGLPAIMTSVSSFPVTPVQPNKIDSLTLQLWNHSLTFALPFVEPNATLVCW